MVMIRPLSLCLLLVLDIHITLSAKLRPTYHIPRAGRECLLEKLHEQEHATFTVTIIHGDKLKASTSMDGPIAPESAATTSEVEEFYKRYQRGEKFSRVKGGAAAPGFDGYGNLKYTDVIDFEHVKDYDPDFFDDDYVDDDDDDDDDYYGNRYKRKNRGNKFNKRMDTWQQTFQARTAGWYTVCVRAAYSEIYAEMDFRKASELGMTEDGMHVMSWDEHERLLHDQHIDEDAATEDDLQYAKEKIKALNKVVHKIRDIQMEEQRRLEIHKGLNEKSHSRMVWGSVLETAIFIVVSFVQVFYIRRWFKDPILGM